MSKRDATTSTPTQGRRWVLYGGNVVLSCVVVVVLAGLVIYLGQAGRRRFDLTTSGLFSLKPQTLNVIGDLKSPVKLVSLYSRQTKRDNQTDYCQAVEDLLLEYQRKGHDISVDFIDPLTNLEKKDALIADVSQKYGGEIKKYRAFLDGYSRDYAKIEAMCADEAKRVEALPLGEVKGAAVLPLADVLNTLRDFPDELQQEKDEIDQTLKEKIPRYSDAVSAINDTMQRLSGNLATIETKIKTLDTKGMPAAIGQYFADAPARYDAIKKLADGLVAGSSNLGELKLETLRQSLRDDSILVMGNGDLKVLSFEQVWSAEPRTAEQVANGGADVVIRPTFAGEQQITTAIFALMHNQKTKVVFVRPGGSPLTDPGMLGLNAGPLSDIADRLREYNFDVQEKDASGLYAREAEMRGMPAAPEPSDAEMKDAIWVVLALPMSPQEGMPSANLGQKLAEHLSEGGSALVLPYLNDQSVRAPLREWGIDVVSDAVIYHEVPPETGVESASTLPNAIRQTPFLFDIRDYGDNAIARPLRSLPSLLYPILPVTLTKSVPTGITASLMLPVPTAPEALRSWGQPNVQRLGENAKFDPAIDMVGPLYGGATAERANGGRLVVISALNSFANEILKYPDEAMRKRGLLVAACPGNADLFCNSIFWLARLDTMLAISPSAMEVSRVADMSRGTQIAWRLLVLGGLPLLVVIAGLGVYFARRD